MSATKSAIGPYLTETHAISKRRAIFDDSGVVAYLYLTAPGTDEHVADAWVYNRIPAPAPSEVSRFLPDPPPAAEGYTSDHAFCKDPTGRRWYLLWSRDGDSVALLDNAGPVACIVSGRKNGYSRDLIRSGPWGDPWSHSVYVQTFGVT